MVAHQIGVLVDVRLNPTSRKKGFSKQALARALNTGGVKYCHERELGNPRDNRAGFRDGNRAAKSLYLNLLETSGAAAFARLVHTAQTEQVALLCFERNHRPCHRSTITDRLLEHDHAFDVVKL